MEQIFLTQKILLMWYVKIHGHKSLNQTILRSNKDTKEWNQTQNQMLTSFQFCRVEKKT